MHGCRDFIRMRCTPDENSIESRLIVCERGDLHQFGFYVLRFSHAGFSIGATHTSATAT